MSYANPILPGMYPDPSICRVGEDYYLVNSTFEYFPGVPIFHSRDLVHWRQIGHCLTRPSQLPLDRALPSDGIYAPSIRHHNGRFYMVTTNNIAGTGFRNFFVHTTDPAGEWSEPVWLDQGGIDPSLWFDDDGKVYLTANGTLWAPVRGAYQSEIDIPTGRRLTEVRFLWPGTGGAYPEAAHLFKRGEFYYLTLAEGGTSECHMVTIARSTSPWGPFTPCPHNPILSHRSRMSPIQATGHADLFEDHRGQWWAVFLGYRYTPGQGFYHPLGRETFIAPVSWDAEGWPHVYDDQPIQLVMHTPAQLPAHPWPAAPTRDTFTGPRFALPWVHLRNPEPADYTLAPTGGLTLRCAAATLNDLASPSFIGRRQQHFNLLATTALTFAPTAAHEEAGLTVLLTNHHHIELAVTHRAGQRVALVRRRLDSLSVETTPFALPPTGPVLLRLRADAAFYRLELGLPAGPTLTTAPTEPAALAAFTEIGRSEVRYLTTEIAGGYTGVMIGLYATAHGQTSKETAHFGWFDYEPL